LTSILSDNNNKQKQRSRSDDILTLSRMFIGTQVPASEFVILDILGSGSCGIVFKCQYTPPNTNQSIVIAVKLLYNFGTSTSYLERRFENEYDILKQVPRHNNIVQLLTAYTCKPTTEMISKMEPDMQQSVQMENDNTKEKSIRLTMFVILEYHSLHMKEYMKKQRPSLDVREILKICSQISVALNFLINHRIIHRDMKLDNILLACDNSPVLCDFGMAIWIDERCLGRVDVPGGNKSHTAPEVANEYDRLSKATLENFYIINYAKQPSWELGVICYEIAVGEHPFMDYPVGCGQLPNLHVNDFDVSKLEILNFPKVFISTLVGLTHDDPCGRFPISSGCDLLDFFK